MKRKVIQHSPTSLVITLPSAWIKKSHIRKGDELDVQDIDETLVLRKGSYKKEALEASIDISNLDRSTIIHIIRNLYRAGYDKINLKFDKETTPHLKLGSNILVSEIIHNELRRLLGYEITREKKNSCIIENISEGITEEIPTIMRRIFLLLIDISEGLHESAANNDKTGFRAVSEKHETIERFINYCLRSGVKGTHNEELVTITDYYMLATLDRITHMFHSISRRLTKLQKPPNKSLVELLDKTAESLKVFHKFFYTKKSAYIRDMNIIRYEIEEIIRLSPKKVEGEQDVAIFHLRHIVHLLLDICDVKGL